MSKHTPEPWAIWNGGDGIIAAEEKSFSHGGIALITCNSQVDGRAAKANARRIVACVNACEGWETSQLEAMETGSLKESLMRVMEQRDDLLEVMEDHDLLVRELDVLLNGVDGGAKQASLCDLVAQLKAKGVRHE